MISVDELKQLFGPLLFVAPYGECLVIQGDKFNPDWEADLDDQGYRCFSIDLDAHPVMLVRLKKAISQSGVVYVPPPKPAVIPEVHSNVVEVKETEKVEKRKYALRGPAWTDEDEVELLKEHDRLASAGVTRNFHKVIANLPRFKNRTVTAIEQKLKKLLKKRCVKGKCASVPQIRKRTSVVTAEVEQLEKVTSDVQDKVVRRETLRQRGGNLWLKIWTVEEDNLLVELWNRTPRLTVNAIAAEFLIKFPKRSQGSVGNRLTGLQNEGRIKPRWKLKAKRAKATNVTPAIKSDSAIKSPETTETTDAEKSEKSTEVTPECKPELELAIVNLTLETKLQTDTVKQVIAELREDFEAYAKMNSEINEVHREELKALKVKNAKLQKEFAVHKHADKTGEAMVPPEAS